MAAPTEDHDLNADSGSEVSRSPSEESSGALRAKNRELVSLRPPHAIYCEVHSACYSLFSRRPTGWDAAEVTRVSLSLYLVIQGFRRGFYIPGGPWDQQDLLDFTGKLDPLRIEGDGCSSTLVVNERLATDRSNSTGAVFGDVWHEGAGSLAWVCSTRGSDLKLWTEPIPRGSAYDQIEMHLQQLRTLVGHLGYTAHARIE